LFAAEELELGLLAGHEGADRGMAAIAAAARPGHARDGSQAIGRPFHDGAADLGFRDSQTAADDTIRTGNVDGGHAGKDLKLAVGGTFWLKFAD
jgi:hypothetical protein